MPDRSSDKTRCQRVQYGPGSTASRWSASSLAAMKSYGVGRQVEEVRLQRKMQPTAKQQHVCGTLFVQVHQNKKKIQPQPPVLQRMPGIRRTGHRKKKKKNKSNIVERTDAWRCRAKSRLWSSPSSSSARFTSFGSMVFVRQNRDHLQKNFWRFRTFSTCWTHHTQLSTFSSLCLLPNVFVGRPSTGTMDGGSPSR